MEIENDNVTLEYRLNICVIVWNVPYKLNSY